MRRIHITGGPGTGKTTLAWSLASRLDLPMLDLDGQGLAHAGGLEAVVDYDALARSRLAENEALARGEAWLTEGSNILVAQPLLERAEVIVVLYCSWPVASYRILTRHFKATLARNNRFPGMRRLYRFWRWSSRYYRDANPHGLNEYGTPRTQMTLEQALAPYEEKLVRCRSKADIESFIGSLSEP